MTTKRKWPAAIHLIVPAAMALMLCPGCGDEQYRQRDVNSQENAAENSAASDNSEGRLPLEADRSLDVLVPASDLQQKGRSDDLGLVKPTRVRGHGGPYNDGFAQSHQSQSQPAATFELQPGEELWVIAASEPDEQEEANSAPNPTAPGCGALLARIAEEPKLIPVPLKHTSVTGTIDGYIASVKVKQQFHNSFDSKIEAVYVFPLPQDAAVNEFIMTIGERRIRGIIRERKAAEKIYNQAKSQGHVASLMTQERPNIFTQKVANIEPGKQIDIDIRYFNTLKWDDGAYEFVFPMVVAPRFNPAGSVDPIAAVARGQQATTGKSVSHLAPNERSGHDISLSIDLHAGVSIEHIESINHVIKTEQLGSDHRKVTLSANDSIPNRDFVLRYRVAGDTIKSALMTHRDDHGQYFTMMLYPPADLSSLKRSPMEMVFVLDCSGSMRGQPLNQSKAAVRQALNTLTPRDTFQIIRFSSNASQLGNKPLPATTDNVQKALRWLTVINGGGRTQMIEGIKAALDFPHDEGRFPPHLLPYRRLHRQRTADPDNAASKASNLSNF